jgi:hypothetical protein
VAEQQPLNRGAALFFVIAKIFDTIGQFIKAATYLGVARYAYLSIVELAGKTTTASMALTYITGEGRSQILPWAVSVVAIVWAYTERYLRLKKIVAMGNHNAELERRLDPGRSSSMLTLEGETGPGDKLL